jgi:hypothetical protein
MHIEKKTIDKIFRTLNEHLKVHKGNHYSIVVCGCTALIAKGLINRKTKDVDVLGEVLIINGKIIIKKILQFPSWFIKAVYTVSMDLNMPDNWFNAGPTMQVDFGLPKGIESRLEKISYGDLLDIYYISRIDQIFFKLNHSICVGGSGYQVDDLFNLNPTQQEIFAACIWVLDQYKSENIKQSLLNFLKKSGFNLDITFKERIKLHPCTC